MFRLPLSLVRYTTFEYMPSWLMYAPLLPYWLWLSLKARSLTYFTAVNPCMDMSGLIGESKREILRSIDRRYLPKTLFFDNHTSLSLVVNALNTNGMDFPLIAKPDVGERGTNVAKINGLEELDAYVKHCNGDFIIQEFIDYPVELGVLFHRAPGELQGKVTSVVVKEFLSVTGDGKSTLEELLQADVRSRFQLKRLAQQHDLRRVLRAGERLLVEPIGNHARGTKFLSGNHLIKRQLHEVFSRIASGIDGFCYGRFDLKVKNLDSLYRGEDIKIMELNGITSEPAHIYDPSLSLWQAYKDLSAHFAIIYRISCLNRQRGIPCVPVAEVFRRVWRLYVKG